MLSRLYNALWYPALPFALFAFGTRNHYDQLERLGRRPVEAEGFERVVVTRAEPDGARAPAGPRVWMHAASVGEVEALRPVARRLFERVPDLRAVVTTMTATGREAARRRIPEAAAHLLAPLDFAPAVRAFVAAVRPTLVMIAETELWPNYFFESRRAGARVAIINGRISERSCRRYALVRGLFARALGAADLILAQSEADAQRYAALGAAPERIKVIGNTKLDVEALRSAPKLRREIAEFAHERPLLIAGSTAPGEEAVVARAYATLRSRFPALALVIAPRHIERADRVSATLNQQSIEPVRASQLGGLGARRDADVLLLDTMGELRALYARAAVAFVGGSIAPTRGGQNLAEPAAAAVPVLFGPHHENQRAVAEALLRVDGARMVRDAGELAEAAGAWLADDAARRAAGARAGAAVEELGGAAERALMHLTALVNLA
jgi:3-deoxy-D-manno-octulosonic-acid transferase